MTLSRSQLGDLRRNNICTDPVQGSSCTSPSPPSFPTPLRPSGTPRYLCTRGLSCEPANNDSINSQRYIPNNVASEERDYADIAVLVPAVHILPNDVLIMQPADIPASLSCFSPALRGLLKSPLQRTHDVTHDWWLCWALPTAVISAGTPEFRSKGTGLHFRFFVWEEKTY